MTRFVGKVAVVTGSSSGIGRTVLLALAKAGASVVLHGVNPGRLEKTQQLLRDAGVPEERVLMVRGLLELDETLDNLIQETINTFGRIDILINNAAVTHKSDVDPRSTENFDYVMRVNLRAAVRLVELALPHLKKTKGNIINVSSVAAIRRPFNSLMMPAYGMSKVALETFAKYEAQRLAQWGVRINVISTGPVETNIGVRNGMVAESQRAVENLTKNVTLVGRSAEPEELVDTFLLLAHEKSSYITGSCWLLDGGMSVFAPNSGSKEAWD